MNKRVLVVDDEPFIRETLTMLIEALGHEVMEAGDGAEGLRQASSWRPDLIVTDMIMPVMTGAEFCMAVKADPDLAATPVLMLTSHDPLAARLHRFGADEYIAKPFRPSALQARLRVWLDDEA